MIPRWKQQIGGALIAALGAAFTVREWYTLLTAGYYYGKGSMTFPAFFVVGLGFALFPGYREERLARGEDISELSGSELFTPRWWAILILAGIAGVANYALMAARGVSRP